MSYEECPVCGGCLKEGKVVVEIHGTNLGSFDGYICDRCGEQFLAPHSVDIAHATAIKAGLFGILAKPELVSTQPSKSLSYDLAITDTTGRSQPVSIEVPIYRDETTAKASPITVFPVKASLEM